MTLAPDGAAVGLSVAAVSSQLDTSGAREMDRRARRRDAALVEQCRSGDEAAWAALVQRFASYVYAILTRGFGFDQAVAEDVFQEVFIKVYRRIEGLDQADAIKPWIAQLTRRAAIDRLRATRPMADIEALPETGADDPAFELIERAAVVSRALAELPSPYRDVVERYFILDQSYRTIAAELDLAPGTIASRISRGLAMLRGVLEEDEADARG